MKATCSIVKENISNYIDGAVSRDLGWNIDIHIATCPECGSLVRSMRQTVSLLGQVQPKTLSADFDAKLAAKIAAVQQAKPAPLKNGFGQWLATIFSPVSVGRNTLTLRIGIAAAALSLVGVFIVMPHSQVVDNSSQPPAAVHGAVSTMDSEDSTFAAACANEQNQTSDSQALNDPEAQTLAARFDEVSGDSSQATAVASPTQD